jgi:Uma2 family endonuclease
MATVIEGAPVYETLADLQRWLGDIPAKRIRLRPLPGTATEDDVVHCKSRFNCLCELVDGVLVEKTMGFFESRLAIVLAYFLERYLEKHDLGIVLGEGGLMQPQAGTVRAPDVSFFSWDHFWDRLLPSGAILRMAPDLAVEVLSPSNTKKEMLRKRQENFAGGTRLVWEIDPKTRTVRVYTSPTKFTLLRENQSLDGGDVLPGFKLSIRTLFARAGRRQK